MRKPRILIVNCYSDNHRHARGNVFFAPHTMATGVLAGMLNRDKVEVRVACEFLGGPFEHLADLAWAELLVLTGLNTAFDRMKQLAALARTVNPAVAVAVGGPLARVLPRLSRRYFDYVCSGDVEEIVQVADEVFGPGLGAESPLPRYDLMAWRGPVGYAESSRNCNFRCNFCAMTAEGRKFMPYDLDYLRRQVEALGYRRCVMFLDQNFFGGPRGHFLARLALLRELYRERRFGGWAALVTADFFSDPEHLRLARESGCIGFFSGVESFSRAQIAAFNKKQNLVLPQEEMIRRCLEAGLVFHYGLVFDLSERRIGEIEDELDCIVGNPRITLPSFLSLAIPLLGTPLFAQRLRERMLLPEVKLRDMDGRTIVCHTLDPIDEAVAFATRLDTGAMSKTRLAAHAGGFFRRYRGRLPGWALASGLANTWTMAFPRFGTNGRDGLRSGRPGSRSFLATTEPLGSLYRPPINVPERYRSHFEAQRVTDADGDLHEMLRDDFPALSGALSGVESPICP